MNGKDERERRQQGWRDNAQAIRDLVLREVANTKPIGRMSDLAEMLGPRTKRGQVAASLPCGGCYVWRTKDAPTAEQIAVWDRMWKRADEYNAKALGLTFGIIEANRTVGNTRVLERGLLLQGMGLTDEAEDRFIAALAEFWRAHPRANTGLVQADGTVKELVF